MPVQRSAVCPDCGKTITLNRDGFFRPHGHPALRCKSSGRWPAPGAEIRSVVSSSPTRGECSRCGHSHRLKKDGTVFRHFDWRTPPRSQRGWCPGSDQKPKENA